MNHYTSSVPLRPPINTPVAPPSRRQRMDYPSRGNLLPPQMSTAEPSHVRVMPAGRQRYGCHDANAENRVRRRTPLESPGYSQAEYRPERLAKFGDYIVRSLAIEKSRKIRPFRASRLTLSSIQFPISPCFPDQAARKGTNDITPPNSAACSIIVARRPGHVVRPRVRDREEVE